jgi:hypothetical protein
MSDRERACAHRTVMPVVPQSLLSAPVTASPGPAASSYDMDAAFMSFQLRSSCMVAASMPYGPALAGAV